VLDALGIIGLRLPQHLLLLGFSPVLKHFASKFLNLFNRYGFCLVGSRTVGYRLIHLVSYFLEPPVRVRSLGETFVQSFWGPILLWQFIAHELL